MLAICHGDLDLAELLIGKGANVNIKDRVGDTVLTKLCRDTLSRLRPLSSNAGFFESMFHGKDERLAVEQYNFAKLLIDNGADVNSKNKKGQNAVMLAAEKGQVNIKELLISRGARLDAVKMPPPHKKAKI